MNKKFNQGVSLVELLISVAIGIIIILAAIVTYLGASTATRVSDAQMRMGEDAYAALTIISQNIKMAGNNPIQVNRVAGNARNPITATTGYYIRGCNHKFSNITTTFTTTVPDLSLLTCSTSTTTDTHSISVVYEADQYNTMANSGTPADCLGQSLTAISSTAPIISGTSTVTGSITYYVAENRFYIGTSTAIVSPSLYCKGSGGAAQPIVENVEDLKITYGTIPATGTSTVIAGYLTAGEIATQADLAALASTAERWSKVVTIRVCVLMRSEQQVVDRASSAVYVDCNGTLITNPPDLRLRRAYTSTMTVRNRTNINQ